MPLFDIILLTANHWSYHAGEINALLSILRGEGWEYTEEVDENHISPVRVVASVARLAVVSPQMRESALQSFAETHALTSTQRRALQLVLEGFVRDEVAVILNVTPDTVRFHLDAIRRRTGAPTTEDILRELAWMTALRSAM